MKDIAFHITDIAENCTRAGATHFEIDLELCGNMLILTIADNGSGMSEETVRKVTDPFYTTRTTRKVGLGLPFLIQNAEQSGGTVAIDSIPGEGTKVEARFGLDNIDCPPVGDLPGTLMQIIIGNPSVNVTVRLINNGDEFSVSTAEITEILDGIPLGHPQVAALVQDMIAQNAAEVFGDKFNL